MMGALDQKYAVAVRNMRVEAARRRIPFKELVVILASEAGYLDIPLWNEDFDAALIAREVGAA